MPRIDASSTSADNTLRSSMVYGVSRAGKSVFNATYPRPAIFCSEREGGYVSIQTMDQSLRYEPNRPPYIYAVSSIKETMMYFKEVEVLVKKGDVQTIVIELSFYSDDILKAMSVADEKNGWAKYKNLGDHISFLDVAAKRLGVRVAYNALAADPGDVTTKAPAGIQVAGKALARMLPASTDLTGYLRTEDRGNNQIDRVLHLTPYGAYPAGHRYGGRLPVIIRNPTFRKLEDLICGRSHCDEVGNVVAGPAPVGVTAPVITATVTPTVEADGAELPPL